MQNLKDEELAIQQAEEMQAVDAVLKGKFIMTGEQFEPVEVDMQRCAANTITQFGRQPGRVKIVKRLTRPTISSVTRSAPAALSTLLSLIRKAGRCSARLTR